MPRVKEAAALALPLQLTHFIGRRREVGAQLEGHCLRHPELPAPGTAGETGAPRDFPHFAAEIAMRSRTIGPLGTTDRVGGGRLHGRMRCLATVLALGTLASVPVLAAPPAPGTPEAVRPRYTQTPRGFEHFVQDTLGKLVTGQEWEWGGHHYRVVKLHAIQQEATVRTHEANRNYDTALHGRMKAIIHVVVDGRLIRARIVGEANYVWQPGGWEWERVQYYLGGNRTYDFVSRQLT